MSYSTLNRSKPMSRGRGFRRGGREHRGAEKQQETREERLAKRAAAAMQSARATVEHLSSIKPRPPAEPVLTEVAQAVAAQFNPMPKERPVRSKPYLRLVASLPCAWCGLVGYSQAAHDNVGKGKSIKACDLRTFPLCCDRPMQRGCHSLFDNYALVSRGDEERRFVEQAIARTQAHIALVLGWPKSVPMPKELKELLKNRGAKHD